MALGRMFGKSSIATILGLSLSVFSVMASRSAPGQDAQEGNSEAAAAQAGGNVAKLLEDGLTLFRQGDYKKAADAFEKAFVLDPAQDQIVNFMEASKTVFIMQMLRSDDPKISGIARTILELRRAKVRSRSANPEQIQAVVNQVFSTKDEQEKMLAMLKGANEFGRNLIPFLIAKLGDSETSVRTLALVWIPKIEIDAIAPLVAASKHPDVMVRQNIARLLGVKTIRHPFSLAALATMMEKDTDPGVKAAARESLEAILLDRGIKTVRRATQYRFESARKLYLYPHLNPFSSPQYMPTLYSLKGKDLVTEVVAPFQLSGRMAEVELVEALRIDPSLLEAKTALVANEILQVVEYEAGAAFYGEKEPEVKAILDAQKDTFDWVRKNRIRAQSPEVLFAALHGALEDRRPEVAERIIEIVRDNGIRGTIPQVLWSEALTDKSSRLVRIASAAAIARWNPEECADFGKEVVEILAEAAVNSGIRTVHKVMGNSFNANRFDAVFRDLNLESGSNFPNIALARERALNLPPDLIVIDEEVPPVAGLKDQAPVSVFINEMRKNYRTQSVPVVVAVDPSALEDRRKALEDVGRKVLVIAADSDKTAFKNQVLDKLFTGSDDAKARATKLAAMASEALAYLTSTQTRFPVAEALEPLQKVLQNRPDEVRIPALVALGNLQGAAAPAQMAVTGVFLNPENDIKVREAAMAALGRILGGSSSKEAAAAEVLKAIAMGMADANARIREVSYVAFSVARASDAEQLRLLVDEAKVPAAEAPADKNADAKAGDAKAGAEEAKADDASAEKPEAAEEPAAGEAEEK